MPELKSQSQSQAKEPKPKSQKLSTDEVYFSVLLNRDDDREVKSAWLVLRGASEWL